MGPRAGRIVQVASAVVLAQFTCNGSAEASRRAFVFGISDYQNVHPLVSPRYDADAIKDRLVTLDYNVTRVDDDKLGKADRRR